MCTVLLPPGYKPTAVNKYININITHSTRQYSSELQLIEADVCKHIPYTI